MADLRDQEVAFRGEAIRELMDLHHLSARQFALRVGISPTLVGAWMAGVVVPQIGSLGRLCRVFGVDLLFFFDNAGGDRCLSSSDTQGAVVEGRAGGKRL